MAKIYFVFLLFYIQSVFADQIEGYHINITLTTTSDWCELKAINVDLLVLDYTILINESPNSQIRSLAINQPGNTNKISVKYACFILDKNLPDILIFENTKGDWGNVSVVVEGFINDGEVELVTFRNNGSIPNDPTNKRSFEIPLNRIRELDLSEINASAGFEDKTLFSFYYPWYGSPNGPNGSWFHWDPNNFYSSTHEPVLGYYDSGSRSVQQSHLDWAQDAGIDVFICSWWGINSYEDHRMGEFLDMAADSPVKLSVYFESNGEFDNAQASAKPQVALKHLRYVLDKYGSHPAFYKYKDKPVIFLYGLPLSRMPLEDWQVVLEDLRAEGYAFFISVDSYSAAAIKVFDGFHTYNPLYHSEEELTSIFSTNLILSQYHHKIFAATILPGYDDTIIRTPGTVVDRQKGEFYRMQWDVVEKTNPPWVLITSWNEWHEGSEIEPSIEFEDQYLLMTKSGYESWITKTEINSNDHNPQDFCIKPAYPNPFNSNIQLTFSVPKQTIVRLDIFNILGHHVKSLLSEFCNEGLHEIVWDGRDQNNVDSASGLYVVRFVSFGSTMTQKILLLR